MVLSAALGHDQVRFASLKLLINTLFTRSSNVRLRFLKNKMDQELVVLHGRNAEFSAGFYAISDYNIDNNNNIITNTTNNNTTETSVVADKTVSSPWRKNKRAYPSLE